MPRLPAILSRLDARLGAGMYENAEKLLATTICGVGGEELADQAQHIDIGKHNLQAVYRGQTKSFHVTNQSSYVIH